MKSHFFLGYWTNTYEEWYLHTFHTSLNHESLYKIYQIYSWDLRYVITDCKRKILMKFAVSQRESFVEKGKGTEFSRYSIVPELTQYCGTSKTWTSAKSPKLQSWDSLENCMLPHGYCECFPPMLPENSVFAYRKGISLACLFCIVHNQRINNTTTKPKPRQ